VWLQAIGIDKSASQVAKAAIRHQQQSNLSFHQIEAWDLNSVLKLAAGAGVQFNVVFIDVSGSRRVGDVDELILKYEQVCAEVDPDTRTACSLPSRPATIQLPTSQLTQH